MTARAFGIVVVDGLLLRELVVGGRTSTRLYGPGEFLARQRDSSSSPSVDLAIRCPDQAVLAVLDDRALLAMRRWPRMISQLFTLAMRQLNESHVATAISQLASVEARLLALFWQLADRWGHRHPDAIIIQCPLTHTDIGQLIGARRPTVSLGLQALEHVNGATPSTLRDHRLLLAEPGQAYRRGQGTSRGVVMAAIGDRPAREVTTREVEDLLRSVSSTGVAPRTVNKVRQLVCAIFNYGMRPSTYSLPANPAAYADRRREPERGPLAFYSPEQIEALARSLAAGSHRDASRPALGVTETEARAREDVQDAELVRVAAYAGLRRGGLVALRWRDVDFVGRKLVIRRALSGGTEVGSTKSRRAREVPLPDQTAAALDRLSRRGEFTGPDDYVFCSRLGRRLDPSALRRRYERARDAAGLEPLRFHDLRHTYGSLLVAGGSTW